MNKLMHSAIFALAICSPHAHAEPNDVKITEPRNAAAGFAVTSWMTIVDALGTHCSKLQGEVGKQSMDALLVWQGRNMLYVDAAFNYMADIEDRILAQQGESARQRFRNDRKAEFSGSARDAQAAWFPDGAVDDSSCLKFATHVGNGSLDLRRHEEFYPLLQEVSEDMRRQQGGP